MLEIIKMRVAQISDLVRSDGWLFLCRQVVFINHRAIVVEKNLSEVAEHPGSLDASHLKVIEFDPSSFSPGTYRFALASRRLKALHYIEHGCRGFGLVRDDLVVGDMWYCFSETESDPRRIHADLRRFGFTDWDKTFAYTFDIFVIAAERKLGVSAAFQNSAMLILRSKGFTKAFGFYWADNLQAHWCTRVMNKWKKIRSVRVSRFLALTLSAPLRD